MTANAGLSYDQAPPFGLPLAYFLAAPGFLLLAALLGMVTAPDWLASRWSPASLALTHLLTLGFLGMVMFGALLQMLPVLLGAPVPAAVIVARAGWFGLALGTPMLGLGLWLNEPHLLLAAMLALLLGISPLLIGLALSMWRTRALPGVAWPMRKAWLALLLTLALGLWLAGGLAGFWSLADPVTVTALHVGWGLGGWVLFLVVGVAYQVVPMLQITPAYPVWLTRGLSWLLFAGLFFWSLLVVWPVPAQAIGQRLAAVVTSLPVLGFAVATLLLQLRRRRKLADVTLDFWRLGMASLILCALVAPWLDVLPENAQTAFGIAFLLGFAVSVVSGMLYKIVPFLAWFHLQAQTGARAGSIPNMKEMIADAAARRHFRLHLIAVPLLVAAPLSPDRFRPAWLAVIGSLMLALSAVILLFNLIHASRLFLAHGGHFRLRKAR